MLFIWKILLNTEKIVALYCVLIPRESKIQKINEILVLYSETSTLKQTFTNVKRIVNCPPIENAEKFTNLLSHVILDRGELFMMMMLVV